MNGTLHAGHSFTISKAEFMAGVERMRGRKVLFPVGFHCTGMPIKACADKLIEEVKMFGTEFENYQHDAAAEAAPKPDEAQTAKKEDVTKFSTKKSKAAAKNVKKKYQFQIMQSLGIPRQEIHRFADPQHWLEFFPPLCRRDLTGMGARIDWRRSFVTTDANPYYDTFVRWQMNRLKELDKIKFGKRYTIYSIKDGQPCMDHDRSQGEGVNPQEYTALKLKVLEWAPEATKILAGKIAGDAQVFLIPATLRPETMYGQTCCFVGPKISYGLYQVAANVYYVVTHRAARNMAYQGIFAKHGEIKKAAELHGSDMVGSLVHAPLSCHNEGVRVLPMETVLPTKGTGVVTSVPSDSPEDYATVTELAKKSEYYGIRKEWTELEIFPIIETPSYGDLCAPFLVKKLKINSPKDIKQLGEAKELAYREGFYQGILKVGDFKGQKVEDAKPKVRQQLIDSGEAFAYSEPEALVVSRSSDDCIVALMDQWYLDYGESSWRDTALEFVENTDSKGLNTYVGEVQHQFKAVLMWLNQWACARTYGLGSKLPWDSQFLVESLSDSTIYMAYYTVAHYLHKDIFGREKGIGNIASEQMTDEAWDYVFCRREIDEDVLSTSKIPKTTLESMRREFEYWYPLDLRVSGKDLVPNHLTFFVYIHLALFPREYWPKSIRANGHLTLNGEKMSKSTGNFMTLHEMLTKYGADATRIALADAGDSVTDANFEEDVADNSILRLFTLKQWIVEELKDGDNMRTGDLNSFQDALFDNEMNSTAAEALKHYDETNFKLALKSGFYDFLSARDFYREACNASGIRMHKDLVFKYIELQALLLAVIAPHWAEYIWVEILKKDDSIHNALLPKFHQQAASYLRRGATFGQYRPTSTRPSRLSSRRRRRDERLPSTPRNPGRLPFFALKSSLTGRTSTLISCARCGTQRPSRLMTRSSRLRLEP